MRGVANVYVTETTEDKDHLVRGWLKTQQDVSPCVRISVEDV